MSHLERHTYPALLASIPRIRDMMVPRLAELGFDSKKTMQMCLVMEEVAVNIVKCAYEGCSNGEIIIEIEQADEFTIRVIDNGIPFDPLDMEEPDIDADIPDRAVGGLGIFIVRKLVDKITYERINDQNQLTLIKT